MYTPEKIAKMYKYHYTRIDENLLRSYMRGLLGHLYVGEGGKSFNSMFTETLRELKK